MSTEPPEATPVDLAPGQNTADLTVTPPDFCCQDTDQGGYGDDDQALLVELDATTEGTGPA